MQTIEKVNKTNNKNTSTIHAQRNTKYILNRQNSLGANHIKLMKSRKIRDMGNSNIKKYIRNTVVFDKNTSFEDSTQHCFNSFRIKHRKQGQNQCINTIKFSRTHHRKCRKQTDKQNLEHFQIPYQIQADIRKIFGIFKEFQQLGFSQKSICQWMSRYFSKKNIKITQVFMKVHVNQKSLNNSITYLREKQLHKCCMNLQVCLKQFPLSRSQFVSNQIHEFRMYLQNILIKKTQSKLKNIANSFKQAQVSTFPQMQMMTHPQMKHFISDLKLVEQKNGELKLISKINRVKFEILGCVQNQLSKKINDKILDRQKQRKLAL